LPSWSPFLKKKDIFVCLSCILLICFFI
jgi:hypothetical protein